MPRKIQFTAEDVVGAAFELVRNKGLAHLSAPNVAAQMGCSTMPIYSHFENMQALEDEVVRRAWYRVGEYQAGRYTGDVWVDQAIGYVRFARDETHLFRCLLDGRNTELKYRMNRGQWQKLGEALQEYPGFKNLEDETILRARYARSMLSHGIATAARIGLNQIFIESDDLLSHFLTGASRVLLEGFRNTPPMGPEQKKIIMDQLKKMEDGLL